MFEGTGITVLLAAAAGAVAGNLLGFVAKRVDAFVRGTSIKIDDKVWFAVRDAMSDALEDFETGLDPQSSFTPADDPKDDA